MKRIKTLVGVLLAALLALQPVSMTVGALSVFDDFVTMGLEDGDIFIQGRWASSLRGSKAAPRSVFTITKHYEGALYLENATVDLSDRDYVNLLRLEPDSSLTLYLTGSNTILAGAGCAGITVPKGAALTILGEGSLTITGGAGGAGIGGDSGMTSGEIIIGDRVEFKKNNARITASGGADAAGIGGGAGGGGGEVRIWAGLIAASGSGSAQDIGRGAGGKAGYTRFHGGRLVNYDNIGWRPDDSARRQEIRVRVDSLDYVTQAAINAIYTNPDTVYTTDIPKTKNTWETEIAYLYIPADMTRLKLLVEGVYNNNILHHRTTELYVDIPENRQVRIDVLAD